VHTAKGDSNMTSTLRFEWRDSVSCYLCNPGRAPQLELGPIAGVVVSGPTWRREVCLGCIMTLEDFFRGCDAIERQLEPAVAAAPGAADVDTVGVCACGELLPPRALLAGELRDALQTFVRAGDVDMRALFSVLSVTSRLEHCEACSEKRIGAAFEAITAAALTGGKVARRRPYTAPAIEHSGAVDVDGTGRLKQRGRHDA
jgi:hypothetical protein